MPEPIAPRYNLRTNRQRDYSHRFDHHAANPKSYDPEFQLLQTAAATYFEDPDDLHKYVHGYIMTQMTVNAGIRKHGQDAVNALLHELSQLDNKRVFQPIRAEDLTTEQRREALRAINLIKEKRCGKLKGSLMKSE